VGSIAGRALIVQVLLDVTPAGSGKAETAERRQDVVSLAVVAGRTDYNRVP